MTAMDVIILSPFMRLPEREKMPEIAHPEGTRQSPSRKPGWGCKS
jgi:hypothetical protein